MIVQSSRAAGRASARVWGNSRARRQLLLQAALDGELPGDPPRGPRHRASEQALLWELRQVKSLLLRNKPERRLSEPRASYWRKIKLAICQERERQLASVGRPVTPLER